MSTHPPLCTIASVGQRVKSSTNWWALFDFASSLPFWKWGKTKSCCILSPVCCLSLPAAASPVRLTAAFQVKSIVKYTWESCPPPLNSANLSAQGVLTVITMVELVVCTGGQPVMCLAGYLHCLRSMRIPVTLCCELSLSPTVGGCELNGAATCR